MRHAAIHWLHAKIHTPLVQTPLRLTSTAAMWSKNNSPALLCADPLSKGTLLQDWQYEAHQVPSLDDLP